MPDAQESHGRNQRKCITRSKPDFGIPGEAALTGLDRMLGGPLDDTFYGAGAVAFMYGNGGSDVIHNEAGEVVSGGSDDVDSEQWISAARQSDDVWYIPGSDSDQDKIAVRVRSDGQLVVDITQFNGGFETRFDQFFPSFGNGRDDSAQQFRFTSGISAGAFAGGAETTFLESTNGWADSRVAPENPNDLYVVLIDARKGDDEIVVAPGVSATVWANGGEGHDRIEIKANGVILPDQAEESLDATQPGVNDTPAGAFDLGQFSASALLKGLTIHTGLQPADEDWYRIHLSSAPAADDFLRVSGLTDQDGMFADLYTSPSLGAISRQSIGGRLDLSGLQAGTYWLRVGSNERNSLRIGIATVYELSINLGPSDPRDDTG